ncbi:MAG: hypothetical protein E6I86_02160 [Chloroflexi bacterium]|nr:MAG: hypothetical protein E6I86_02160 [Chloroflexota bacterium]
MEVSIVKSRLSRWLAPLPRPLRRMLILVVGSTVALFGVLLLVLPGPGILVIIVGLAILATEFAWAEALLAAARRRAARVIKKFSATGVRPSAGRDRRDDSWRQRRRGAQGSQAAAGLEASNHEVERKAVKRNSRPIRNPGQEQCLR